MADFTFTDRNKKVVLHSWGRHRATVVEAVAVGDLVSRYATDNAYTYQIADESDDQAAEAVALQDIAAGDEGWFALAAELKAPVSVGTLGAVTRTYFAEAADFLGKPLYLSTTGGKAASSEGGSTVQLVGVLLARDRILLSPGGGLLTGAATFTTITASGLVAISDSTEATGPTDGSLKTAGGMGIAKKLYIGTNLDVAGTAVIDGTLLQTGIATFTAAPIFNAGFVVPTGYDVALTKGNVTLTAGVVNMIRKTSKTETGNLSDDEQGYVEVSPVATTVLTLPTAAAGKYFLIKHLATTQTLEVAANTSDKIIDPADGGVHDKATDDKGLDCILELRAVDEVNWLVIHHDGDWTFAD